MAWRLQRGALIGWAAGLFLGGISYGSIGKDINSLIGDSEVAREMFGADGPDLVDSFYASSAVMLVLIAAGYAISSALRARAEENEGRVEPLLGTAGIVVLAGFGMGLGYLMVTGDESRLGAFTWAATSRLPGVLVLAGVAVLLYGLLPRAASLAWLGLLFCVVVMMFGEVLQFPDWVRDISPFEHLALVPAVSIDWSAALMVLAVAAGLFVAGRLAFLRRDVH